MAVRGVAVDAIEVHDQKAGEWAKMRRYGLIGSGCFATKARGVGIDRVRPRPGHSIGEALVGPKMQT
jgi:hypothetical protein